MAIREGERLSVVAVLEELLGTAMHESDAHIGGDDDLVLDLDGDLQPGVTGRMPGTGIDRDIVRQVPRRPDSHEGSGPRHGLIQSADRWRFGGI